MTVDLTTCSSISVVDKKKLIKVMKKAISVPGCPLDTVEVVSDRRMRMNDLHLLKDIGALTSSFSDRLLHPKWEKERHRKSLVPPAQSDCTISSAPSSPSP